MPPPWSSVELPQKLPLRVLLVTVTVSDPVVDAAGEIGRVAANCAVAHCQRRAAIDAIVVDTPADAKVDRVAADCAAAECQGRVIIVDTAAKIADDFAIGDSQPGYGNVFARGNVKHAAGVAAVHGQRVGAGA